MQIIHAPVQRYAKTSLLAPGQTEKVTVTFDKSQLTSYDAKSAKTYILDAGDYYIAAGRNAHDAMNNILASKGYSTENGMTAESDTAMTYLWKNDKLDTQTYSVSSFTGAAMIPIAMKLRHRRPMALKITLSSCAFIVKRS